MSAPTCTNCKRSMVVYNSADTLLGIVHRYARCLPCNTTLVMQPERLPVPMPKPLRMARVPPSDRRISPADAADLRRWFAL